MRATRLTREQAAIICAYTGMICGPFADVQDYAERKLGRQIMTHEFGGRELAAELKKAAWDDFMSICALSGDMTEEEARESVAKRKALEAANLDNRPSA